MYLPRSKVFLPAHHTDEISPRRSFDDMISIRDYWIGTHSLSRYDATQKTGVASAIAITYRG
jgi:hypothetical protein